jgi:WbqC-like protein family
LIESEENYIKQSYRNRCYILSAHGPQLLSVPVYLGSQHKTPLKEIRIDYSKRWQQVHLRAITASYSSSPYFQFYFENIEKIIARKTDFLFDLNMELTWSVLKMLGLNINMAGTTDYKSVGEVEYDYRYKISPKRKPQFPVKEYIQVFDPSKSVDHRLSIIDLIFNTGPEAVKYL